MWNRALLVLILSASASAAQIPSARLAIVGSVPKAGSLSLGPSDPGIALLQGSMTGNSRQVQLRLRPSLLTRKVTVPLIARSNAPYRLIVRAVTRQDDASPQPIQVVLRSVSPNAGTRHLMADATNVRPMEAQGAGMREETTIVEGPRISSGGTDATSDNALRMAVEVELPESLAEAELIFTMELY